MCLFQANIFIDKRFGEYDENISLEEKMLKRFATEKQVWSCMHNVIQIQILCLKCALCNGNVNILAETS